MSENSFLKHSGVFEMFGLDFMLDENMNLWFIECNSSPQLIGTNDHKTQFLTDMLTEMFNIQYGLLRSRMKRIHKFMRYYQESASDGDMDWQSLRKQFRLVNKNSLEPEYETHSRGNWHSIVDYTRNGLDRYNHLLEEECIDDFK